MAATVVHRAGVPTALLVLASLTLSAVAGSLPVTAGLVADVPVVEAAGEWGGSLLPTVGTAVGVLVALRIAAIALAAVAWLVFPLAYRELLAELGRRAREVEEERR